MNNIRKIRLLLALSVGEISEKFKIQKTTYRQWENGYNEPNEAKYIALSSYFTEKALEIALDQNAIANKNNDLKISVEYLQHKAIDNGTKKLLTFLLLPHFDLKYEIVEEPLFMFPDEKNEKLLKKNITVMQMFIFQSLYVSMKSLISPLPPKKKMYNNFSELAKIIIDEYIIKFHCFIVLKKRVRDRDLKRMEKFNKKYEIGIDKYFEEYDDREEITLDITDMIW
ncbi:MAG: helix-turn-helix transcriptional regulator [Clostridiales Family XIII bacterium]|jgi:transcriptional regulator with XRE-family HTH domain|nr:helix-turn-helix transcriptional regulator [Clostridiales Family XIII bacterium]